MTAARTKPLDQMVWQDIVDLGESGMAEDAMLEFKGLLPEKNGKQHPWYEDRDQLTDYTRDQLAAEVVAFANAYGGRIVIGIAETQDRPRKAAGLELLPRCEKFVEQFEQALRSVIDPPIGGLQVKAIPDPAGAGAGAVVVAIPASDVAPHGIGRPPAAYVRRGTACEPMTMRDLQSVFWDARARRERIVEIRAEHRARLKGMLVDLERDALVDRDGKKIAWNTQGLFVRVSAIPQDVYSITPFPFDDWRLSLRPSVRSLGADITSAFGDGHFGQKWSRTAHGAWGLERGPAHWLFRDDGAASLVGFRPGYRGKEGQDLNFHFPGWYSALVATLMVAADRMRRTAGRPDIPIELDLEFLHQGTVIGGGSNALTWGDDFGSMLPNVSIGPFLLASRNEFHATFLRLEEEIWHSFGLTEIERSGITFDRAFR